MKSKHIKVISATRTKPSRNRFYGGTEYYQIPKIQMEGKWLEALGFHIGDRLHVEYGEGSISIQPAPEPSLVCEPAAEYNSSGGR